MIKNSSTFVWLEEKSEPLGGYVLFTFDGGKRLCVKPIDGCSKCNSRGRVTITVKGETREEMCSCVRVIFENQRKAQKATNARVFYEHVARREQSAIARLEGEMATCKAERDEIVAQAKKRASGLETQAAFKLAETALADTTIVEAQAQMKALEAEREPLLAQMSDLRKKLCESSDAIETLKKNLAQVEQGKRLLVSQSEEAMATAAALRSGAYGERAEKLAKAIAKREAAIAESRAKLATKPVPEPTATQDAPTAV
jgi:cell division protein FtsB